METTLAEVFGGQLSIDTSLDENLELDATLPVANNPVPLAPESKTPPPSGVLGSLLESFGGEAV